MRIAFALLGVLLVPFMALGGPPFVTDDPEPVDFRHWEFYSSGQLNHDIGGWSGAAAQFELNEGPLEHWQVGVAVPAVAFSAPSDGPIQAGLGDIELSSKYQFIAETETVPKVAFFPRIDVPTGNADRGLGAGEPSCFLPLWLQKSFGPWTTYGGGGCGINPGDGNQNSWFVGQVVQRRLTDELTLGAEVFHETSKTEEGDASTKFNVGAIYDFDETCHFLVSAGRSIQGPEEYQAYLGVLITFGPEASSIGSEVKRSR